MTGNSRWRAILHPLIFCFNVHSPTPALKTSAYDQMRGQNSLDYVGDNLFMFFPGRYFWILHTVVREEKNQSLKKKNQCQFSSLRACLWLTVYGTSAMEIMILSCCTSTVFDCRKCTGGLLRHLKAVRYKLAPVRVNYPNTLLFFFLFFFLVCSLLCYCLPVTLSTLLNPKRLLWKC